MSALATPEIRDLDFDWFRGHLEAALGRPLPGSDPGTLLHEDLGWDSVDMLEVLAVLDANGVVVPDDLIGELRTLGDIHHYLANLAGPRLPFTGNALAGPNVRLEPIRPADHDFLYSLCVGGDALTRFRLRANTPSPEQFHRLIWERVVAQFIVYGERGPIGWVTSFDPDYRNRHVHVAAVGAPGVHNNGQIVQATAVLVSFLFTEFDFRKIYAETLQGTFSRFASGAGRHFQVEGRLSAHEYVNGHYEDLVVLGTHRAQWREAHRALFGTEPGF